MRGDYGPVDDVPDQRAQFVADRSAAAAAPFPYATSAAEAVYRRMPNETDLTVFLDAGMAGMNFAAAGGITRYHTALDNADLLDQRTLQHQGIIRALDGAAVRLDRSERSANQRRGFLRRRGKLIHYSAWLAIPLAILVTILVLVVIWIGIRDGRFSIGGIAVGFAIYTIAIAVCGRRSARSVVADAMLAGWRMLPVGTTYGGFYYSVAARRADFRHVMGGVRADRQIDFVCKISARARSRFGRS